MRRLIAIAAIVVIGAAGMTTASAGAVASERPTDGAAAEHQRIVDHWTAARRDSAEPRDLSPDARAGKPGGGGGGGGGGSGGSGVVTGATWTGGGDVVLTTGKLFFDIGAYRYTCSGGAVDTTIGTVVLTAGHCVKDGAGAFVTNWVFYPGYRNGPDPTLGAWTASDLFTTNGWGGSGTFADDAGFAVVYQTGSGSLESAIQLAGGGSVWIPPIDFGGAGPYHAFGYPAAKKYKGQTLTYCAGPATAELDGDPGTMSIACDMTGGSSGGPWLRTFGDGSSRVSSLNSHGYTSLQGYMFGPIFGAGEQAAFDGAAAGDCPVSPGAFRCVDYVD